MSDSSKKYSGELIEFPREYPFLPTFFCVHCHTETAVQMIEFIPFIVKECDSVCNPEGESVCFKMNKSDYKASLVCISNYCPVDTFTIFFDFPQFVNCKRDLLERVKCCNQKKMNGNISDLD